ncbi:MAG TPA: hypothetical protein VER55_13870 [Ardenticatenaceae bacterium]|nr:hypothetical protein [Ardenticatenaceae bacterium]
MVDTDDLNVVTNADDLADVRTRVRSALGMGTYQQSLPLEGLPRPLQKAHTGSETGGRIPVEARRLSELQAFHRTRNDTYGGGLFVQALRLQENVGALARELALAWEAAREVNPASQGTQGHPTLEGRHLPSAGLRGGLAACLAALFQLANEAGVDLEDAILEQLGLARAGVE